MANRQFIADVGSGTQSKNTVMRFSNTGSLVRQGGSSHPDGSEVVSIDWLKGFSATILKVGVRKDLSAFSIAGRQLKRKDAYRSSNGQSIGDR